MGEFFIALLALTAVALLSRRKTIIATAVILSANWLINSLACKLSGVDYPYAWFMISDYASGLAVVLLVPMTLQQRPNLWQLAVTMIFAAQVVWHVNYMWSSQSAWINYYSWYFLSYSAWGQVLLTGFWAGASLCVNILRSSCRVSPDQALR